MKYIFFLLPLFLHASSSFITASEYAAQLYKNPRGIGCGLCHGVNGEGMVIATYKHKNKERKFIGPKINTLSYKEFRKALLQRKRGMPRYFLTNGEMKALYLYLHEKDGEQ